MLDGVFGPTSPIKQVVWREVQALADDPDQPWNPRLQLLAEVGLGWAAAVPFRYHGQQGIVVYLARQGVDQAKLQSVTNETYLVAASDLIGAAFCLQGPRAIVVEERRHELSDALRRVKRKIVHARQMSVDLGTLVQDEAPRKHIDAQQALAWHETKFREIYGAFITKLLSIMKKTKGAGVLPPPRFTIRQSCHTFVATFATLLVLTRLQVYFLNKYGTNQSFELG